MRLACDEASVLGAEGALTTGAGYGATNTTKAWPQSLGLARWLDAPETSERCEESAFKGLAPSPAGYPACTKATRLRIAFCLVLRGPWPRAAVEVHGGSRCVPNVRAKLPAEAGTVSPD
jgi:hypothetical protein